MERLLELDRRRRRLREWMDAEDSGVAIEPSPDWYAYSPDESSRTAITPRRATTPDRSAAHQHQQRDGGALVEVLVPVAALR